MGPRSGFTKKSGRLATILYLPSLLVYSGSGNACIISENLLDKHTHTTHRLNLNFILCMDKVEKGQAETREREREMERGGMGREEGRKKEERKEEGWGKNLSGNLSQKSSPVGQSFSFRRRGALCSGSVRRANRNHTHTHR